MKEKFKNLCEKHPEIAITVVHGTLLAGGILIGYSLRIHDLYIATKGITAGARIATELIEEKGLDCLIPMVKAATNA